MSFATDTAWPAHLLKIFEICRNERPVHESRYNGPYNTLLAYCFGDGFKFFVNPQKPKSLPSHPRDIVDFTFTFIVNDINFRPVLFAEIKDDRCATEADLRFKADDQMRQRYDSLLQTCPLPRLWGLSFLGSSMRVYCGEVADGSIAPAVEGHPTPVSLDFLEGAWGIDVLSQEGFEKMKEIVGDIFGNATAL